MADRYQLIEDDPRFGLSAGDVLICERYWLDPGAKLTVLHREADGYDPECNVYRCSVRLLRDGREPRLLACDCGCAPLRERREEASDG